MGSEMCIRDSGDSNKVWVVPSELNDALKGLGSMAGGAPQGSDEGGFSVADPSRFTAPEKVDVFAEIEAQKAEEKEASEATVQQAIQEAAKLENPGLSGKRHREPSQVLGASAPVQVEAQSESTAADQGRQGAPGDQVDQPANTQYVGDQHFGGQRPSQDQ